MRTIKIGVAHGGATIVEEEGGDEGGWLTVHADEPGLFEPRRATIRMTAEELMKLAVEILGWFGAVALNADQRHGRWTMLRERIERVLAENESRCLDDNIDRDVVIGELMKALQAS
jgi:hypothetical protein